MKIVSKFHVLIFYSFRELSRQKALRSSKVGPVHRSSPKMVIKIVFKFFDFFKGFRAVWLSSRRQYECLYDFAHSKSINNLVCSETDRFSLLKKFTSFNFLFELSKILELFITKSYFHFIIRNGGSRNGNKSFKVVGYNFCKENNNNVVKIILLVWLVHIWSS